MHNDILCCLSEWLLPLALATCNCLYCLRIVCCDAYSIGVVATLDGDCINFGNIVFEVLNRLQFPGLFV